MFKRGQSDRSGVRAALRDARETYRRYSGAEPNGAAPKTEPNGAAPKAEPNGAVAKPEPKAEPPARRPRAKPPAPVPAPPPATVEAEPVRPVTRGDEDVVLDVSKLHVDEIDLKIDDLQARVALEAHILELLKLDVGVEAALHGVDLKISGVDAQALLRVRLENLSVIVDRVMSTIDQNPQILERLTERLEATLGQVGASAARAVGDGLS
jgi:hypothetical protein